MNWKRFFSTDSVKGTKDYLISQRKYEIIRTMVYYIISLSLFFAGLITTGTRNNILTIVAVLGCLPASKSLVGAIMYCKYKSLSKKSAAFIEDHDDGLYCLYDLVFTTREKSYPILHMTIQNQNIIGYAEDIKFSETDCEEHMKTALKIDHYTDITVKIFTDIHKYTLRMDQLKNISDDSNKNIGIANTLKSISL